MLLACRINCDTVARTIQKVQRICFRCSNYIKRKKTKDFKVEMLNCDTKTAASVVGRACWGTTDISLSTPVIHN